MRRLKHVLVTGGAGFIGSNFVRLLRRAHPNLKITVLDKLTYAGSRNNLKDYIGGPGYRFVRGSITNEAKVAELAKQADGIVNFAAQTHVDRSLVDPLVFIETNVAGTAVLCEAARRFHHQVFLQVSTDEVYGHVRIGRAKETDVLRPRSPYSASKAASEHVARAYAESFGLPVVVIRATNGYGPYQHPEKLIPLLVTNAIDDRRLPLYNDGSAVRDFLFVEDLCEAMEVVLHKAPAGETYNIGTGVETSGLSIAEAILATLGKPRRLIQFVVDRSGHDYRYAVDARRIRALGWKPSVNIRGGLERTVRWYLANEEWWRPLKSGEYWEFYKRNYRPLEKPVS